MGRVKTESNASAGNKGKATGPEKKEEEKPEDVPEDPPVVKQLKEIDDKYLELEREYEREVQKLLVEYTKKQQPLLDERKKVLTAPAEGGPVTGTPALSGFWLKALQNHPAFEDSIQEWDEPVLEFLTDIEKHQDEKDQNKGFKLTFHFLENPYFEHTQLTKEYVTDETNPYSCEIEVKEVKSSTIEWKAGKNVTVEKVAKKVKGGGAKKQKQKAKGEKEQPRPSFFREFFRTLHPDMKLPDDAKEQARSMAEDEDEDDDDDEELIKYLMEGDHEIGTAVRDNIIPFAIRWYTGEAAPDYDPNAIDDEDEEEESEEEISSEEDERPGKGRGKGRGAAKKAAKPKGSPENKPSGEPPKEECKQQ